MSSRATSDDLFVILSPRNVLRLAVRHNHEERLVAKYRTQVLPIPASALSTADPVFRPKPHPRNTFRARFLVVNTHYRWVAQL
jgi:hypothetical protein